MKAMWMRKDRQIKSRPAASMGVARGFATVIATVAMLFAALMAAQPVSADPYNGNNAARVSAYIKPCFGMLLDAQLRSCGGYLHYRPTGCSYGYCGAGGPSDVYVDCDRAHRGYVEDVVRRIRPGGVLHLKARNQSCIASLDIQNSITIIGESYGPDNIPVLVAPDGQSCLRIESRAERVVLRDVYISSPRGDNAPCIESYGGELSIQNSEIRYIGDGPAVHLSGGRLDLIQSSHVIGKTRSPAIDIDNGVFFGENSEVTTTSSGIRGNLSGDSQIQGVTIQQLADWRGFERGDDAVGLDLTLNDNRAILSMTDLKVLYFPEGIHLDGGGEALLAHSLIDQSAHGIVSSVKRTRIIENTILADEIGVDVQDGIGYVGRNQIAKVRVSGITVSTEGKLQLVGNEIDPISDCNGLKWGYADPSQRTCKSWYEGSAFDVPGDAEDQYLFEDYWPRSVTATALNDPKGVPLNAQDPKKP